MPRIEWSKIKLAKTFNVLFAMAIIACFVNFLKIYLTISNLSWLSSIFKVCKRPQIFGMATLPFLCNGTLLFQCNLPRVLPVTIYKYASCLIPYIISFLILCGEWPSLVFKDFLKYFCVWPNACFFLFAATVLKIVYSCFWIGRN